MRYFLIFNGNKAIGSTNCETDNTIEVSQDIFQNFNNGIVYELSNNKIIDARNTEEYILEQNKREIERIKSLKLTKRVFALALQKLGISYTQLKELIATNEQAQLEWDLCVELQRSNPLLDIMCGELGITSEQLNNIFIQANNIGE